MGCKSFLSQSTCTRKIGGIGYATVGRIGENNERRSCKPWRSCYGVGMDEQKLQILQKLQTLRDVENDHIRKVITACDFNFRKSAQVLGIDRRTLYRRLESMGAKIKRSERVVDLA